ncbi:MAG: hypothetical protein AB7E52_02800, partial [Bdellovibrionales bacterium]
NNALLAWSENKTFLAATENCPTCRGSGTYPCPDCKGIGHLHCETCHGTGRELCPLCLGKGRDPAHPENECYICHGEQYSICRFCHGNGKLLCPTCQGKGAIACSACNGSGCVSRECILKQTAEISFSLGPTSDLPSGLLRMISRTGENKIYKQHADIRMIPPSDEDKKNKEFVLVRLEAQIPYADIKIRFGKKGAMIACFGKKTRLSGVPFFLDEALKEPREQLAQKDTSELAFTRALQIRLIHDALGLTLSGQSHPNHLRRLYPVGLSGPVAAEIMKSLAQTMRRSTERARQMAALLCVLGAGGFFALLFYTPTFDRITQNLPNAAVLGIKIGLPLLAMLAAWSLILHTARHSLTKRFPASVIALRQHIGKTGLASLGAIAVLYGVLLVLSGHF